jgi:hypothetical protein
MSDGATVYIALSSARQMDIPGEMPTIERYTAARIHDVYRRSQRDDVGFRVLSGALGLLKAADPIALIDHSMHVENVAVVAHKIATQIDQQSIGALIVHTSRIEDNPRALIYLGCVQIAAGIAGGAVVEHRVITDAGW